MKKTHYSPPPMGGSSLLVSFGVLMLTVLALLTLSQSRADKVLSEASARAVAEYYAADTEGEKILAQLRNGLEVPGVTLADGVYAYSCPVSQYQTLLVEVRAETWQILRWETVAHPDAPSETLPVWQTE